MEVINHVQATIEWKTKEEGGRSKLPLGKGIPPYATLVRFLGTNEPWPPENAWSLVVEKQSEIDPYRWVADVYFLVADAPKERLIEGAKFELYEGNRCVASGAIL
jgi:hypothetical protein